VGVGTFGSLPIHKVWMLDCHDKDAFSREHVQMNVFPSKGPLGMIDVYLIARNILETCLRELPQSLRCVI
jgi:hypothetical protein